MKISTNPTTALFFSGIHMDMLGALAAPALLGASNPGKFATMPGGASLNSASVATLLGLDCGVIGLVGDDTSGQTLVKTLAQRNIDNLLTICPGKATGSYTSIIEPDGNLLIALADLDLNEEMHGAHLCDTHAKPMSDAQIWFLNSNLSAETLLQLSDRSLKLRPKILAAASISPSKAQKLAPSLANLDVLFTNIAEANALVKYDAGKSNDGEQLSVELVIEKLQHAGVATGTLSHGGEALWVWDEIGIHRFKPPSTNNIIDVTGAGDALAGVFLAGLARGKTLREMAAQAIAAAQMTLNVKGPYNADINWQDLALPASNVAQTS